MITNKNIVLIGPMATGKTAIGKLLSKRFGKKFIDSDEEIIKRNGVSIDHIFQIEGENGFRLREEKILLELIEEQDIILATGGGSILSKNFRKRCKQEDCLVIYLFSDIETLYQRTKYSRKRPILKGKNKKEVLKKIIAEREEHYNECADIRIDSSAQNIEQTIDSIEKNLNNEKA